MKLNLPAFFKKIFPSEEPTTQKSRSFEQFLKQNFGIFTQKPELYHAAFIHKSFSNVYCEKKDLPKAAFPHNERLEFLGDAILSAVLTEMLFHHYPKKSEGELSVLRSKLVSRKTLNRIAEKLEFDKQLLLEPQLSKKNKLPPSILGNALEAFIGAAFLDQGYDFTRKLILEKIYKPYVNVNAVYQKTDNYKSSIIQWAQKKKVNFAFESTQVGGSQHRPLFLAKLIIDGEQVSQAEAQSKKEAEQKAAKAACEKFNLNN